VDQLAHEAICPSLSPFSKNIYEPISNQLALLFIMRHLSIKLPVTFARTMKHEIELQTCQSQICANPFFRLFGWIVPQERPHIPLIAHFFENLPDESGSLLLQQYFKLVWGVAERN